MSIAHLSKPGMAISSLIVAEDILLPYGSCLLNFHDVRLYRADSYWHLIVSTLGPRDGGAQGRASRANGCGVAGLRF
jgi:hypothetical protein